MYAYLLYLWATCSVSAGWVEYVDKEHHFKVSYPEDWYVAKEQGVSIFFMVKEKEEGEFSEHLTIMAQDLSQQPMTLEEFTQLSLDQYNQEPKPDKMWPIKDTELGGVKAKSVVLTIKHMGLDLKAMQYWFVKDSSAYLFTYTAYRDNYDRYEKDAQKLIESFQFIN